MTKLTFRQTDGVPTECVMDARNQWTLVYGDAAILAALKAFTTIRQITPLPGGFPLHVQIQQEWRTNGFRGEFDPPYKTPQDELNDSGRIY